MQKFKRLRKFILILLALIILISFSGCNSQGKIISINNYDNFLKNLIQYQSEIDIEPEPEPGPEPEENKYPQIDGFKLLFEYGFIYAMPFKGTFTFINCDNQFFLIDKDGNMIESDNLEGCEIVYDKIIYKNGGMYGVKSLDGKIIAEAKYTDISINRNTILAKNSDGADIYINDELFNQTHDTDIYLCSEEYLQTSNGIFTLELKPLFLHGYKAFTYLNNNIFSVMDMDSLQIGCANSNELILEPEYDAVLSISENYIIASKNSKTHVIDRHNTYIFTQDSRYPIAYDGEYLIFSENEFYGLADKNFNTIIASKFPSILNNRVYGDNLIVVDKYYQIYSINSNEYVSGQYKNIIPVNNYFITENIENGKFSLLNSNLEVLIENCDNIQFSENILFITKDNASYFYIES